MKTNSQITGVKEVKGSGVYPKPEPRVFKPVRAFKYKLYLYVLIIFTLITTIIVLSGGILYFIVSQENPSKIPPESELNFILFYATIGYLLISAAWISISLFFIPVYLRSFKYVVHGTEIVVHKGLINKSEKHVPFRTITHISSRAGILDRIFGIGTVEIQTAGGGGTSTGPEEKIEGIRVYKEVRDFILNALRKLKFPQSPTGGIDFTEEKPKETTTLDDGFLIELLDVLRDIRGYLSEK